VKHIVLRALVVIVVWVLVTGCATPSAPHNDDSGNVTFSPFSVPPPNVTRGPLIISNGGWTGEYPVSVDNMSVGVVSAKNPLSLMIQEGSHVVEVCCGRICERENVTVSFGKQQTVDLSEQLKKDLEFSEPAMRITGYYLSGDRITVAVEFINPTMHALTMTADVSCGYSYIDSRTYNRFGNSAQGRVYATVNACDRVTQIVNLDLATGSSYMYDMPTISTVSVK
jgi:hypothetical protein